MAGSEKGDSATLLLVYATNSADILNLTVMHELNMYVFNRVYFRG